MTRRLFQRRRDRSRLDLISKAWGYLPAERLTLVGLAALSLVAAQAESTALVLIALMADAVARGAARIDLVVGPIDIGLRASTTGLVAGTAIVAAGGLMYANSRLAARVSARLEREGRDEMVSSFSAASWEYQSTQKSSRVQGRLLRLMDARAVTFSGLVGWARAMGTIAVFIVVAAFMSPVGAVVIVLFGAILSLAVLPIRRRVARLGAVSAQQEVELTADVAEAVDHGADVHVFDAWSAFVDRFFSKSHAHEAVKTKLVTARYLTPVVYQYGAVALILAVMITALAIGAAGQFGQMAASALLLLRSVQYGQQLQTSLQQVAESVPRIDLLIDELSVPPPRLLPGTQVLDRLDHLELVDVSYRYPDGDELALDQVSLELKPGTIVGMAGPSGSGKSTLAQILLRLRWPESGQYLVNGRSAQEYSENSWKQRVAHVPQHSRLLHGSLAENVSFLDDSIPESQIRLALEKVGLEDLVETLPGGFQAPLGPTVRSLSGGQVQRLGIARALVREPHLVVLDEPTSALDVDAERLISEALNALRDRADVLTIVIAHRPSTLALCETIVVLTDGRVDVAGESGEATRRSEFLSRTWGST